MMLRQALRFAKAQAITFLATPQYCRAPHSTFYSTLRARFSTPHGNTPHSTSNITPFSTLFSTPYSTHPSTLPSDLVLPTTPEAAADILTGFSLINDFITPSEEQELYDEVHPYLRKLRYEYDHWDNAIHGFRETERQSWSDINQKIIARIRDLAFPDSVEHLQHVHVLDLSKDGHIKPHVDSVRFCGSTIAGVTLLSPCVFKLIHVEDVSRSALALVKPRSLYIMRDVIRYKYTHEVLKNELSMLNGKRVEKDRRISIICRSEPKPEDIE